MIRNVFERQSEETELWRDLSFSLHLLKSHHHLILRLLGKIAGLRHTALSLPSADTIGAIARMTS